MLKILMFLLLVLSTSAKNLKVVYGKVPVKPFHPDAKLVGTESRIVGGFPATDSQFPFANEVNVFETATDYNLCTGTFLTTSWALTALHCLDITTPEFEPIYIKYGAASRTSPKRLEVQVDYFTYWVDYDGADLDFVLLRMVSPIQLGTYVATAQLPPLSKDESHYEGFTVTQVGFGQGKDLQFQALSMQFLNSGCIHPNILLQDRWSVCALSFCVLSNSEMGDSGGPWFILENGKATIVGTHIGRRNGYDHMATRMSSFIREISAVVGLTLRP